MAKSLSVQGSKENQPAEGLTRYLSEAEIRKQLLVEILQDKASLIPMAVSLTALIYALLYAPVLGGLLIGVGVFLGAALVTGSVFVWRFVIRYQQNYALKSAELVALFEAQSLSLEEEHVLKARDTLDKGFRQLKASEGINTLHSLDQEYQSLKPVLSSGKEIDLLSLSNLEVMVKQTYFRGLSVLEDVFELERAIRFTDHTRLQSEIAELQRKAAVAQADPDEREQLEQVNERIASNQERLDLVRELKQRVGELLYQAKRCEASLGKTRIELAALKADASEISVSAVIEALRKTVDRAREVQDELNLMNF